MAIIPLASVFGLKMLLVEVCLLAGLYWVLLSQALISDLTRRIFVLDGATGLSTTNIITNH